MQLRKRWRLSWGFAIGWSDTFTNFPAKNLVPNLEYNYCINLKMNELNSNLRLGNDGVLYAGEVGNISYPEEGQGQKSENLKL